MPDRKVHRSNWVLTLSEGKNLVAQSVDLFRN